MISNTKLGLLVFWPTFWTGFPIKLAVALLLLAGHMHPWEGTGLYLLLLISIPIDIWALGLCARTLFIERLRIEPQPGLGLSLWWQWALLCAIFLPLIKIIVGAVKAGTQSLTHSTVAFFEENVMEIPVAEQITIELVMWGIPTTLVLILLLVVWLYGLGAITQRSVRAGVPQEGNYQAMVYKWDLLRIPADQPLLLTAFTGVGVVMVCIFWVLLPVSTPHPHEEYEFINPPQVEVKIKPLEVLKNAEKVISQASLTLESIDKSEGEEGNAKGAEPTETKKEEKSKK
jgi:hypothetical protein